MLQGHVPSCDITVISPVAGKKFFPRNMLHVREIQLVCI